MKKWVNIILAAILIILVSIIVYEGITTDRECGCFWFKSCTGCCKDDSLCMKSYCIGLDLNISMNLQRNTLSIVRYADTEGEDISFIFVVNGERVNISCNPSFLGDSGSTICSPLGFNLKEGDKVKIYPHIQTVNKTCSPFSL